MTTDTEALPPLPKPWDLQHDDVGRPQVLYTAKQVRAYARAAIAQRQQVPSDEGARKLVNEFARACCYGEDAARIKAGDALVLALAQRQQVPAERPCPMCDGRGEYGIPGQRCEFCRINSLPSTQPIEPAATQAAQAQPQEPVATVYRGGSEAFGWGVLVRWNPGADTLPAGEHLLYAQPQEPPRSAPLTEEQMAVLRFLYGHSPLRGAWYGDKPEGEKGSFWWRRDLVAAFPELRGISTPEEQR